MRRALLFLLASAASLGAQTVAIVNARIHPASGPAMERATLLIEGNRIAAVGPNVKVPAKARKIDGTGLSVYPGWIDGWTQLGISEISGVTPTQDKAEIGPFNPAAKAWIALNPHSDMLKTARVNGVTTALVAPTGGLISGTAAAVNLLGRYPDQMLVNGENGLIINVPRIRPPRDPADTAARRSRENLEKLREYLREAKRYSEARARAGAAFPHASLDPNLEALIPVLRRERPAICPADHFRDIRAAVELGEEFGLRIVIAGGADAWKIAGYLKAKNVPVLYSGVHELPPNAEDPYDAPFATPEMLRKAGVPFAIVTGSSSDNRNLPYRAAMASSYGLEQDDAVRAITLWPAQILGIADKTGSLETGKLANLIVSKGDPLDLRSEIRHVFIEGREVPPESRNRDLAEQFR